MNRTKLFNLPVVGAVLLCLAPAASLAGNLEHGDFDDFGGGGVLEYLDVTEIEPTSLEDLPLFDEPFADVNELVFEPTNMLSGTSDGEDPDRTAADLELAFEALPGTGLRKFTFEESGGYSLLGTDDTTDVTRVLYGIDATVTVTEVDGVAVAPFDVVLADEIGDDRFDEIAFDGVNEFSATWDLSVMLDLGDALADNGFGPMSLVTAGEIVIRNTLAAFGEEGSIAFIEKDDFAIIPDGTVDGVNMLDPQFVVPEPVAWSLGLLAFAGLGLRTRVR